MKKNKLTLAYDGEEHVEMFLNGKHVVYADHDQHGWGGMELVSTIAETLSTLLGWKLEIVELENEEE